LQKKEEKNRQDNFRRLLRNTHKKHFNNKTINRYDAALKASRTSASVYKQYDDKEVAVLIKKELFPLLLDEAN
jgi:hypothetical protein